MFAESDIYIYIYMYSDFLSTHYLYISNSFPSIGHHIHDLDQTAATEQAIVYAKPG